MGLLSRTLAVVRYGIGPDAELADIGQAPYDKLELLGFRPFAETDRGVELRVGWVPFGQSDQQMGPAPDCEVMDLIYLTVREDRRRVPASLLRREVAGRTLAMTDRLGRTLTRAEREDLRSSAFLALLDRALPSTTLTDVVIDRKRYELVVLSAANSSCDSAKALFTRTFDARVGRLTPENRIRLGGSDRVTAELGGRFLKWLWCQAWSCNEVEDCLLSLGDAATFKGVPGTTTVQGDLDKSPESAQALAQGKLPTRVQFSFLLPEKCEAITFVLCDDLTVRGAKLPALPATDEEDVVASVLIQYEALRELLEAIDAMFLAYLTDPTADAQADEMVAEKAKVCNANP